MKGDCDSAAKDLAYEILGSDGLSLDESVELEEFGDYLEGLRTRMKNLASKFKGTRLSGKQGKSTVDALSKEFLMDEDYDFFEKYRQKSGIQSQESSQNSSRSSSPPPEFEHQGDPSLPVTLAIRSISCDWSRNK